MQLIIESIERRTNKRKTLNPDKFLETNEMKILKKIVSKTEIHRIRGQQIRESGGIQPINEWTGRRKREWDEVVMRMDAERVVKI